MVDSTSIAIVGSVTALVFTYWLNGLSERSLERRRVNYTLKLKYFETAVTHMNLLEKFANSHSSLFVKVFTESKSLNRQYIVTVLNTVLRREFTEEMAIYRERLLAIRTELLKTGDDSSPIPLDTTKEIFHCISQLLVYYNEVLAEDNTRLLIVADTNSVLETYAQYLLRIQGVLDALSVPYEEFQKQLDTIKRLTAERGRIQSESILAMKHELKITMLGWPHDSLERRKFKTEMKERTAESQKGGTQVQPNPVRLKSEK